MASETFDFATREPSSAIVEMYAEALDVDPCSIDPPLHTSVDLEAVDKILGHPARQDRDGHVQVTVEHAGVWLTAESSGTIRVHEETAEESRD